MYHRFFRTVIVLKKIYLFFIYLQSTVTGNGESIHQINYSQIMFMLLFRILIVPSYILSSVFFFLLFK